MELKMFPTKIRYAWNRSGFYTCVKQNDEFLKKSFTQMWLTNVIKGDFNFSLQNYANKCISISLKSKFWKSILSKNDFSLLFERIYLEMLYYIFDVATRFIRGYCTKKKLILSQKTMRNFYTYKFLTISVPRKPWKEKSLLF